MNKQPSMAQPSLSRGASVEMDAAALNKGNVIVLEALRSQDSWVSDSERKRCHICNKNFSAFRRKHHCRVCGEIVCSPCALKKQLMLPSVGQTEARVCVQCVMGFANPPGESSGVAPSPATVASAAPHGFSGSNSEHSHSRYHGTSGRTHSMTSPQTPIELPPQVTPCDYPLDYDWEHAWPKPPVCQDESERLEDLYGYDILDTPQDDVFDIICDLASKALNCSIAGVSFIDETRQWFKSSVGLIQEEIPRNVSFCAHVVYTKQPILVADTQLDKRFDRNPLVTGRAGIRFYAAAPIICPGTGRVLGTVFVFDVSPRMREPGDVGTLEKLAQVVMKNLEDRKLAAVSMERPSGATDRSSVLTNNSSVAASEVAAPVEPAPDAAPEVPPPAPEAAIVATESAVAAAGTAPPAPKMETMLMDLLSRTTVTQQQLASQQSSMYTTINSQGNQIKSLADAVDDDGGNSGAAWVSKKDRFRCDACAKKFHNLFRRRHHCRLCGNLFCKECIQQQLVRLSTDSQIPVKTCATCAFEGPPAPKASFRSQLSVTTVDSDRFAPGGDDLLLFSPVVADEFSGTEYTFENERPRCYSSDLDFDETEATYTSSSGGASPPAHEVDRLEALHSFRVLHTPPDETFNIWCDLAATSMECPIAVVSFMDSDRQWFKAKLGIAKTSVPRHLSFCANVVATGRPEVVLDTHTDARFGRHPLVTHGVRFYAGAPLVTPTGFVIGTLAVFDVEPRRACHQLGTLEALAQSIMKDMEERRVYDLKYRHRRRRQAASFDDRALRKAAEPVPVPVRLTPDLKPLAGRHVPSLELDTPSQPMTPTEGKMETILLDLLCRTTETQQHLASQQGSMFATLGQHSEQIDKLARAGGMSPFARKSPRTSAKMDVPALAISQIIHPDDWVDHSHRRKCYVCAKVFNKLLRRKHNCRMCGEVICSKCRVAQRLMLARNEQPTVAQVCLVCVQKIPVMQQPPESRHPARRSSGRTAVSDNDPSTTSSFFVFHDDHQSVTSHSNISSTYSTDVLEPEPEPCSYRLDYNWDYPWPKPPPVPPPVEKQTAEMLALLEILDTPREDAFDRIAASARKSVAGPCKAACVSLMDYRRGRQWFKAFSGVGQAEMPLLVSFCAHTVYLLDVTVVLDTARDERFAKNPLVTTESTGFRFYAGAPIIVENVCVGTVFIMDSEPRTTTAEVDTLKLTKLAQLTSQLLLERKMLPAHCSIKGGVRSMSRSSSAPSKDQMTIDREQETVAPPPRKRSLEPPTTPASRPPRTPTAAIATTTEPPPSPSMEAMLMNLLSKTTETQQQIATQQGTLFDKLSEHNSQINKLAEAVARMEAKLSTEDEPPTQTALLSMPATPRFVVRQDDGFVYVDIHVPYVRVSELEYTIDGCSFHFYCKPYLLNLTFPLEVVDDERAKAVYDINKDHGTIYVHLPKAQEGAHFPDLDLLTTLLQQRKWKPQDDGLPDTLPKPPLIEVVGSSTVETDEQMPATTAPPPVATDSSLLSLETKTDPITMSVGPPRYGFNNRFSDFFKCWHGEVAEILALPAPDTTPAHDRTSLQHAAEDRDFDVERYLIDFAGMEEDEYFAEAMGYTPFWAALPETKKAPSLVVVMDSLSLDPPFVFTEPELELLRRLPAREHLLSRDEQAVLFGGLCDLLASYAYDLRTTQGDSTVESAWTIMITSSTLAWLNPTADLAAVAKSTLRRVLSYPLLRQHALALRVLEDVVAILKRGKRVVLRCLLTVLDVLGKSDQHYLLNSLFLEDYCVWIQRQSDVALLDLAERFEAHVAALRADKDSCGWALKHMEAMLTAESSSEDESSSEEESSSDEESKPVRPKVRASRLRPRRYAFVKRDELLKRSDWVPKNRVSTCDRCARSFGILHRKHHCHTCGNVFCGHCTLHQFTAGSKGHALAHVRVCWTCVNISIVQTNFRSCRRKQAAVMVLRDDPSLHPIQTRVFESRDVLTSVLQLEASTVVPRHLVLPKSDRVSLHKQTACRGCHSNFLFMLRKDYCRMCGDAHCPSCLSVLLATASSPKDDMELIKVCQAMITRSARRWSLLKDDLIHPLGHVPRQARSTCSVCLRAFSLFRAKYNCALCGHVICRSCVLRLPVQDHDALVMVCEPCLFHEQNHADSEPVAASFDVPALSEPASDRRHSAPLSVEGSRSARTLHIGDATDSASESTSQSPRPQPTTPRCRPTRVTFIAPSDLVTPVRRTNKSLLCSRCQRAFGYFQRQLPCRTCGQTVCGHCSVNKLALRPDREASYDVVVCKTCVHISMVAGGYAACQSLQPRIVALLHDTAFDPATAVEPDAIVQILRLECLDVVPRQALASTSVWVPTKQRTHCAKCKNRVPFALYKSHCHLCGDAFCVVCLHTVLVLDAAGMQLAPQKAGAMPRDSRSEMLMARSMNEVLSADQIKNNTEWVPDNERSRCNLCTRNFGSFRRKHHCRMCGEVVCNACLLRKWAEVQRGSRIEVKVCMTCILNHAKSAPPKALGHSGAGQNASFRNTRIMSDKSRFSSRDESTPSHLQSPIDSSLGHDVHPYSDRDVYDYPLDFSWGYPWPKPPEIPNEEERLQVLRSFNVLDTPREDTFEIICDLASKAMNCPIAVVSLMDKDRQWFKANVGLAQGDIPRNVSFCAHTIISKETMVVLDAKQDKRFAKNPLVTGAAAIRFYAGSPIVTPSGHVIGTVFVFDTEPRTTVDIATLEKLSNVAMKHLEDRRNSLAADTDSGFRPVPPPQPLQSQQSLEAAALVPAPNLAAQDLVVQNAGPGDGQVVAGPKLETMLMDLLCRTTETQQQLATQQGAMFQTLGQHTAQIDKLADAVKRMEAKLDTI
ncbi:hypothetical protein ACHHYP_00735 [Achlya hypogyna]|uniref:FYVE-type domain-containing protein n=1 Tax=Achlya hypogyna TaxID=1202772 RepID=A0A1V9ZTW6_ACHHY|nr:hypothetical protein ACHHYP_00735 [Achlya hypogyna]